MHTITTGVSPLKYIHPAVVLRDNPLYKQDFSCKWIFKSQQWCNVFFSECRKDVVNGKVNLITTSTFFMSLNNLHLLTNFCKLLGSECVTVHSFFLCRWWLDQGVRRPKSLILSTGSCLTWPCRACSCSPSGARTSWKWWGSITFYRDAAETVLTTFSFLCKFFNSAYSCKSSSWYILYRQWLHWVVHYFLTDKCLL